MPRAVQLISRLSVGGSVLQAINTTAFLRDLGWDTVLLHGEPGPGEGSMQPLADELGIERVVLPAMARELGPNDARSLAQCRRELVRLQPDIVHTHGAKAGTVGRVAARLSRAPAVVHTFHGHVLRGYFGPRKERAFRLIERGLAHACDRVVAVSDEVRDDLVDLHVAPATKIEVIPVGFDMHRLSVPAERHAELRAGFRREVGLTADALVVTFVGRVVPIKRADRFLAAAEELRDSGARFVVVGDGDALAEVRGSDAARALGDRVSSPATAPMSPPSTRQRHRRADVRQRGHSGQPDRGRGLRRARGRHRCRGRPQRRAGRRDGLRGTTDASLLAARIATLLADGALRATSAQPAASASRPATRRAARRRSRPALPRLLARGRR